MPWMRLFFLFTSLYLSSLATNASAKPQILVSIKPLGLILQEIAGDKIALDQLLPDQASHHDYPMKMSDHRRLRSADLVVWIGPELESFLARPLANISVQKQMAIMDIADLEWPDSDHEFHDAHHHSKDPHLWLNPENTVKISQALAKRLGNIDAEHADYYHENANKFIKAVGKLDQEIQNQMKPVQDQGFAVYHQAYGHFVSRYHLKELGYLTLTPERKSGAKHLATLYTALAREGKCIFAEPLMDKSKIEKIARQHQLRVGYLDVMGIEAANYAQLMQSISDNFSACLSGDGSR